MTFAQLYNSVIDNTQRSDKLSVIKNAVNNGILEISKLHEWFALRITTSATINANDLSTALAIDFYQLVEARCINPSATSLSYPLWVIPKTTFLERYPYVTSYGSGRPWVAYEENGTLFYFPKSSQTYTLAYTYLKQPASLSADSDTNPLTDCDYPVVCWATSHVFATIQAVELSAFWMQRFEMTIQESIRANKRRVATEIRMVEFTQDGRKVHGSAEPWNDPFAGHEGR